MALLNLENSKSRRPQAVAKVQVSNEHFIVTEWRFAPGAETGWHTHGFNYAVVPLTNGDLLLETPDGFINAPLVAGQSYARVIGVEHNVINNSLYEVVFVEIESRRS